MFDRNLFVGLPPPRAVTNHITHLVDPSVEKGAKHLAKVEKEAAARITAILLEDVPEFNAQLLLYSVDRRIAHMDDQWRVAFTVNGRRFDELISVPEPRNQRAGLQSALKPALAKVSEAIADAVMARLVLAVTGNNALRNY